MLCYKVISIIKTTISKQYGHGIMFLFASFLYSYIYVNNSSKIWPLSLAFDFDLIFEFDLQYLNALGGRSANVTLP